MSQDENKKPRSALHVRKGVRGGHDGLPDSGSTESALDGSADPGARPKRSALIYGRFEHLAPEDGALLFQERIFGILVRHFAAFEFGRFRLCSDRKPDVDQFNRPGGV